MAAKLAIQVITITLAVFLIFISGCVQSPVAIEEKTVPHEGRYGIYSLDLASNDVDLIYSTDNEIYTAADLNERGDTMAFVQKIGGDANENTEIFTIGVDGTGLRRLTDNDYWDIYPVWSADDTKIVFLSFRDKDMDLYMMDTDGSGQELLFDSGLHDADPDSKGDLIVFTSGWAIWSIKNDGTGLKRITSPANAGEWGNANLPLGDYDPRMDPSATRIVFERLINTSDEHGSYDFFIANLDGSGETRLTNTGYPQGLASWSHAGDRLVYIVAAINGQGMYDAYMINADGTNNHNITPDYFPTDFIIRSIVFSKDDSKLYFVGEWWEN